MNISFLRLGLGIVLGSLIQLTLWAQTSGSETNTTPGNGAPLALDATDLGLIRAETAHASLRAHSDEEKSGDLLLGDDPDNHLGLPFARHLAADQRAFWTAPAHFQVRDLKWIAPLAGVTAGFMAGDSWISKQVPLSKVQTSKTFSDYGAYSLIGAGGGAFLLGHLTGNDRMSEAGLLSGEAAINSTAIAMLLKGATQRSRPYQTNGGVFFQGGSSFPSEHAAIAWSIASVMAHEYPGTLTKILAYGLATGVSAGRVTGQQHFASDVVIGSALGWYFGRQVYRAHHDTDLGGEAWGELIAQSSSDKTRNPENMGSPYVALDSWVYPALERLIALGYVRSAFLNIRPWTRMACAQMLEEVEQTIADQDDPDGIAPRIYRELSKEFSAETERLNGAANVGAAIDSVYTRVTNISGPPLRDGYHFAQTLVNDYGRPFGEGTSSIVGASGWTTAGPLALYLRGEYQQAPAVASYTPSQLQAMSQVDLLPAGTAGVSVNTGAVTRFQLLEGSLNLNFRNVQFSFGRQTAWLGPTESGPFLFSDNAAPITMFKMDSVEPFEMPLLSKLLGPARVEFFLGRLSGHQWINSPPTLYGPYPGDQPFIHGNKISFTPTPNLEFGADFTAIFAGAGVPFTFREFLRTYYAHTQVLAQNPGKRFSAFDFRYRVPGLRNWLTVYADSLVVDEYSPITSGRASVNPGFYMPRVPGLRRLQLRAEGINESRTTEFSPGFIYLDGRYLSGYTNQGFLLGNWIGRAGRGGQGWATYSLSPRSELQFSYRAQRVSPRFLEGGSLNDFSMKWDQYLGRGFGLSATAQYENWRFPALASNRQTNVLSSVQLTYWPKLGRQGR